MVFSFTFLSITTRGAGVARRRALLVDAGFVAIAVRVRAASHYNTLGFLVFHLAVFIGFTRIFSNARILTLIVDASLVGRAGRAVSASNSFHTAIDGINSKTRWAEFA